MLPKLEYFYQEKLVLQDKKDANCVLSIYLYLQMKKERISVDHIQGTISGKLSSLFSCQDSRSIRNLAAPTYFLSATADVKLSPTN